MKTTIMPCPT